VDVKIGLDWIVSEFINWKGHQEVDISQNLWRVASATPDLRLPSRPQNFVAGANYLVAPHVRERLAQGLTHRRQFW